MILAEAGPEDIARVTAYLRRSDAEELTFVRRRTVDAVSLYEDLMELRKREPIYCFRDPVTKAATTLHGITRSGLQGVGSVWLIATPEFDRNPTAGVRACRRFLDAYAPDWMMIGNVVPMHMTRRIRWLQLLGFDMLPPEANPRIEGTLQFWMRPPRPRMPS